MNPELKVGDTVRLYHMEGDTQVLPSTIGKVTKVRPHPESENEKIYDVQWEDGQILSLLSDVDFWKKVKDVEGEGEEDKNMMTENEKKSSLNPELSVGDRIKLMHIENEDSLSPGMTGEVLDIESDPLSDGDKIIRVKWEDGSILALLSSLDFWKKIEESQSSHSGEGDVMTEDEERQKKSTLNPELSIGDRVKLMHMEDEGNLTPGTTGVVTHIDDDPTDRSQKIINVNWDNGSSLALLSGIDFWKKVNKPRVDESREVDFMMSNPKFFKKFNWGWWYNYINLIRESGIVNMFSAAPLTYCGSEHLDRYYGENPPNEEAFSELLEMADEAKNKMITACIMELEDTGQEVNEDTANRCARKLSSDLIHFYVSFKMGE